MTKNVETTVGFRVDYILRVQHAIIMYFGLLFAAAILVWGSI